MERKFKIGDVATCTDDRGVNLTKGKEYTLGKPCHLNSNFVRILDDVGNLGSYCPSRFKRKITVSEIDISNMTGPELKLLMRKLKKVLASAPITLYSTTGNKWGKHKYPESKLVMTYDIVDGMPTNIKVGKV